MKIYMLYKRFLGNINHYSLFIINIVFDEKKFAGNFFHFLKKCLLTSTTIINYKIVY